VDKIHDVVLADRQINVHEIAEAVRMSDERIFHISHNEFDLKKLSATCVPPVLSPEQKRVQAQTPAECLKVFQNNPMDFKKRFVTMDETGIYHYIPETKNQSKQWVGPGESAPKKAKTGKVMPSAFLEFQRNFAN
jgi:hypothetical protein